MHIVVTCTQKSSLPKIIGLAALGTILDITSDILSSTRIHLLFNIHKLTYVALVLVIPIHLLWHIQINPRQKIILGATLCLSIVMIIITIVRMSKIRIGPTQTDIIWEVFWHEIEACTAVIMVSISAFRSVFVAHNSHRDQNRNRVWYMSKKNLLRSALRRKKLRSDSEEMDQLPEIPRATMTGMRTFIHGGEPHEGGIHLESQRSSVDTGVATMPVSDENLHRIKVEHTISSNLEEVSLS